MEENMQIKNEEYYLLDTSRGRHNVLANSSSTSIIFKKILRVKNKFEFYGKIEGTTKISEKEIIFNSEKYSKYLEEKKEDSYLLKRGKIKILFK